MQGRGELKTGLLTMLVIGVFGFAMADSHAEELYFEADFDFFNEQSEEDRKYHLGETITIVGNSSFYKEETNEHFPAPNSEFHVLIKNPENEIVHENHYRSDSEGKMEFSFNILNDFSVGEYTVEMIVDKRSHLDSDFFVGHLPDDVVKIKERFDLWTEDSEVVSPLPAHLNGVLCSDFLKESNDRASVYLDPYNENILEEHSVEIKAFYTSPDGEEFVTSSNPEKKSCTNFVNRLSTHVPGEWSVYVTALWMEDGILYETRSHSITYFAKEPLFRGTTDKIPIPDTMRGVHLLDWSRDGKSILFTYYLPKNNDSGNHYLAMLSPDDSEIMTLNIPMLLEIDEKIGLAKFSPDGRYIHLATDDGLFQYEIETSDYVKLTNFLEWIDFDYYHYQDDDPTEYSIVISIDRETYFDDPSEEGNILLDIENGGQGSVDNAHALIHNFEGQHFDISPDGKKILFHKTIESDYGRADRVLAYYPAQGDMVEIPNSQVECGHPSKWTPNGDMVVYTVNSCGRGAPGGTLHLISSDGAYHEMILQYDNDRPDSFVISPDGLSLAYVRNGNFEIMTLTKAVPEFQTIAMLVLMFSVLPVILFRNKIVIGK